MPNKPNLKISESFNKDKALNIICNDAISVLRTIPDNYADHCITDPPYNISGYDFKKKIGWLTSNQYWSKQKNFSKVDENWDKFTNGDYEKFTQLWLNEIFRVVKNNGNIVIFGTYHNIYKIGHILQKNDKKIINSIVWFKRNAFPNITQRMLCESTEHLVWAVNNNQKKAKNWIFNYEILKNINKLKECKKCKKSLKIDYKFCPYCGYNNLSTKNMQMRNVWNIPITPTSEKTHGKHPTQKPIEVIKKLILGLTDEKNTIIDPFTGSGTMPLVAKMLNRKFVAIDNNKKYCLLALKRLNAGQQKNLGLD